MPSLLWIQLRQQFVTVDGLVDDVVATYHNGFNKAIHNYSHILQLFADTKAQVRAARASAVLSALLSLRQPWVTASTPSAALHRLQVETVKRNLDDAKRRLGTTSRSMQQQVRAAQWQQSDATIHRVHSVVKRIAHAD
jgi:Sec8 exocyst complex component specific domain